MDLLAQQVKDAANIKNMFKPQLTDVNILKVIELVIVLGVLAFLVIKLFVLKETIDVGMASMFKP